MLKQLEKKFRQYFPKQLSNASFYRDALQNKIGLEIGGPSFGFTNGGFLPIYEVATRVDGCNFSNSTVWEGNISEGQHYKYGNKIGYQYIADAVDLGVIPTATYDFILSSHSVEHIANPIKALHEWQRVLKPEGIIVMVVPHKDLTFDHKRPLTTIEHLVQDFSNGVNETDTTHFEEVISLHDIPMDAGIADLESLKARTADNHSNRCVHHHIFNTPLLVQLAHYMQWQILDVQTFSPFHIVGMFKKNDPEKIDNKPFFDAAHSRYQKLKFPSDKRW